MEAAVSAESNGDQAIEVAEALEGIQTLIKPLLEELECAYLAYPVTAGYSPTVSDYNPLIEELFNSSSDRDSSPPASPRLTYPESVAECARYLPF